MSVFPDAVLKVDSSELTISFPLKKIGPPTRKVPHTHAAF